MAFKALCDIDLLTLPTSSSPAIMASFSSLSSLRLVSPQGLCTCLLRPLSRSLYVIFLFIQSLIKYSFLRGTLPTPCKPGSYISPYLSFFFFFFFLVELGFEHKVFYHLSHTSSLFCYGYFGDGILGTICPGWPRTAILPVSASQVSRITDMNHQS
jgi:hypothetical protein